MTAPSAGRVDLYCVCSASVVRFSPGVWLCKDDDDNDDDDDNYNNDNGVIKQKAISSPLSASLYMPSVPHSPFCVESRYNII